MGEAKLLIYFYIQNVLSLLCDGRFLTIALPNIKVRGEVAVEKLIILST